MELSKQFLRVAPEDVGIRSAGIAAFLDDLNAKQVEMHSMMLLRHGRVAAEGWWEPYAPTTPHMLFSLSKSFTATAAGLAIQEGFFKLDDPVLQYFADCAPENPSENLIAMRVRDLLCMGTGHETEPAPGKNKGWEKIFLSHPVVHRPGNYFLYNSIATFMVSSLVKRTTGQGLVDFLKPRLFDKLGIENPVWDLNPDGIEAGGWGLNLRTEDIARFGQMILQEGQWLGEQIVPRNWVRLMTAWQIDNSLGREKDWAQGYCFQFWRCRNDAFRGDGAFGQYCVVMPKKDAVLAITSSTNDMQYILDCAFDRLLPAMQDCLPPDPVASTTLSERMAALALPRLCGGEGDIAPALLGQRYSFIPSGAKEGDAPLCIKLEQAGDCLSTEMRIDGESKLCIGFDAPVKGVFNTMGRQCVALSQAKVQPGSGLLIVVRMPETPFHFELELAPDGDGAMGRMRLYPTGVALEEQPFVKCALAD
jgi:CubicO group peptidase (beta-lactamase class C family)